MAHKAAVITYPESIEQLKAGFDRLGELTALTYGPTQGIVFYKDALKSQPEALTDAATMVRRVTSLGDSRQDVGAMIMRSMIWRVRERVGDGGATTAIMAQAILNQAFKARSAGANTVAVQQGIRIGAERARLALEAMRQAVRGEGDLEAIGRSVTGDEDLAFLLGEIFSILGPTGHVTIDEYAAPYLEREYVDGGRWRASIVSPHLINNSAARASGLDDCLVALYEGSLTDIDEIAPLLELAIQHEPAHLLLVAQKISSDALNTIVTTHLKSKLKISAAALERVGDAGLGDLQDLAALTGARLFSSRYDRGFRSIQPGNLGKARRVEVDLQVLQVSGGSGDPSGLRQQIEQLQRQMYRLDLDDSIREELQMRVGRLAGSMAVLKIGAQTSAERSSLKVKAEQGIKTIQAALQDGVLPGGGCAYLRCIPEVEKLTAPGGGLSREQAMGVRALVAGLEAPFRRLLGNAQVSAPGLEMHRIQQADKDHVYDVLSKNILPARQAGILDPYKVLSVVLETAVSGAAMALGTEVIILKRKPKLSYEP